MQKTPSKKVTLRSLWNLTGRRKQLLIGASILLLGITLIETTLAYSIDYSGLTIAVNLLIGIAACGFGILRFLRPAMSKKRHEMDFAETYFINCKAPADGNALERTLSGFRSHLADFFTQRTCENPPIQNDCTQFYKSGIDLQKRRLDRLGVDMTMISERRRYSGRPVQKTQYFDGKYEVTEIDEEIEAKRRYAKGDRTLLVKTDAQIAHYTMINAKTIGEHRVICPKCGAETTRENLIDGCDYCGRKFHVEDLGEKISAFALRDNYETAYAKYKENREEYAYYAFIIVFAVAYLLMALVISILMFDETVSGAGNGDPVSPLFLLWGFAAVGGSFGLLLAFPAMLFYGIVIFPAMEAVASLRYHNRKNLAKIKKAAQKDLAIEKKIRAQDKLFSVSGFYANVQNKLATVLFADTVDEINTFAETDLQHHLKDFAKVLDFDVDDISLKDYHISDGAQCATVSAELSLIALRGQRAVSRKQTVTMELVKSADCKTKAVCEPYVLTCRSCGSSLQLSRGLVCEYCGKKPDLKAYDWAIRAFRSE